MSKVADRLSKQLTSLAKRRGTGVTADDAQRLLDRWKYRGGRNFIGGVFRSKKFRANGYTQSKLPSNKKRAIKVWLVR